jgi:hypothetical protein
VGNAKTELDSRTQVENPDSSIARKKSMLKFLP